jgi:hypothetical protein
MDTATATETLSFDVYALTGDDAPAISPVHGRPYDVRLVLSPAGVRPVRAIHASVTLRQGSVQVTYSWFGGLGRDAARQAFVAALHQGPTWDTGRRARGPLRGSHAFLRAVRDALAEGASIQQGTATE